MQPSPAMDNFRISLSLLNSTGWRSMFWICLYFLGQLHVSPWFLVACTLLYLLLARWRKQENQPVCKVVHESSIADESPPKLPAWVQHPDVQRSEWLNQIIQ